MPASLRSHLPESRRHLHSNQVELIRAVCNPNIRRVAAMMARQCFAKGTRFIDANNDLICVEDVKIGTKLKTPDGKSATVISLTAGIAPLYKVANSENYDKPYIVTENHNLVLTNGKKRIITTVKDYLSSQFNNNSSLFGIKSLTYNSNANSNTGTNSHADQNRCSSSYDDSNQWQRQEQNINKGSDACDLLSSDTKVNTDIIDINVNANANVINTNTDTNINITGINVNVNANANVNLNQTYLVFNLTCDLCSKFPIIKILYYCPTCSIYICPECEKKPDINHRHSILKIQTKNQFDDLNEKINNKNEELSLEKNNNNSQINFGKIKDNIKDSVLKIFGGNKEENNIPIQNITQQMSLIQIARAQYGLEGISDQQLENAIRNTNGDIEKAIPLLFK